MADAVAKAYYCNDGTSTPFSSNGLRLLIVSPCEYAPDAELVAILVWRTVPGTHYIMHMYALVECELYLYMYIIYMYM